MRTCDNCACDRVCDHNWNGFETCGNWISIDAVPVVRCRECKHWDSDKRVCNSERNYIFFVTAPDFYCADGERKEGADNDA